MESDRRVRGVLTRMRELLCHALRGPVREKRRALPRSRVHREEQACDLDWRESSRRRQARQAAALEEAAPDLRELDVGPLLRGLHQRADRGGVRCDGSVPTAYVPGADEARQEDARVVRVGRPPEPGRTAVHRDPGAARNRRSAVLSRHHVAAPQRLDRRLGRGPGARRRAHPRTAADAGGGAVPVVRAAARRARPVTMARRSRCRRSSIARSRCTQR